MARRAPLTELQKREAFDQGSEPDHREPEVQSGALHWATPPSSGWDLIEGPLSLLRGPGRLMWINGPRWARPLFGGWSHCA